MPKGALSHRPKVLEDLKPICDQAKSIWATPELTHYTDHSVLHSTRVIKHINDLADLLPRSDELNSNEAFVLLERPCCMMWACSMSVSSRAPLPSIYSQMR